MEPKSLRACSGSCKPLADRQPLRRASEAVPLVGKMARSLKPHVSITSVASLPSVDGTSEARANALAIHGAGVDAHVSKPSHVLCTKRSTSVFFAIDEDEIDHEKHKLEWLTPNKLARAWKDGRVTLARMDLGDDGFVLATFLGEPQRPQNFRTCAPTPMLTRRNFPRPKRYACDLLQIGLAIWSNQSIVSCGYKRVHPLPLCKGVVLWPIG